MQCGVWNQMKIWSSHLQDNLSNCLMNLKNSGDSTGFEPMTSAMPVQCSNQLKWMSLQLSFNDSCKDIHFSTISIKACSNQWNCFLSFLKINFKVNTRQTWMVKIQSTCWNLKSWTKFNHKTLSANTFRGPCCFLKTLVGIKVLSQVEALIMSL